MFIGRKNDYFSSINQMKSKLGYLCGSNSWGGLEMNQLKNAIWMSQKGYPVILFCWKNSPIHQNALNYKIDICLIEQHNKYYHFTKAIKLKKIIEFYRISHLIIRSNHDLSIGASVKWLIGKKLHISYFMEMQFGISKTSIFHTIRYKFYDIWSCPLLWLKEQVEINSKLEKSKICFIPSGVELKKFNLHQSKRELRQKLNLPLDEIIIGIFGRIDLNKGHHIVIEAIAKCKQTNFILLIVGETTINESDDYLLNIKNKIENENLNKRIIFKPFTNEIEKYYQAIDILINASKSETVGMSTIEAFACGKPVIGSNSGGTKELIANQKLGYLFEPQNIDDLCLKIEQYFQERNKFDTNDFKNYVTKFDHQKVCEQIEQTLQLKK